MDLFNRKKVAWLEGEITRLTTQLRDLQRQLTAANLSLMKKQEDYPRLTEFRQTPPKFNSRKEISDTPASKVSSRDFEEDTRTDMTGALLFMALNHSPSVAHPLPSRDDIVETPFRSGSSGDFSGGGGGSSWESSSSDSSPDFSDVDSGSSSTSENN